MKRMMIALVIPAVLGLGACKKEEKGAGTGSAAATAAATGAASGTAAATGTAAAPTGDQPATGAPAAPAGDRPAIVTDEMAGLAEKLVGEMEAMGKGLTAAGSDCAKGAEAIKASMEKMKPIVADAKKHEAAMKDPAAEEWFKKTYESRMMGAMGGMMTLAAACQSDPAFAEAMKSMGELDM